jgi:hypothetical protein
MKKNKKKEILKEDVGIAANIFGVLALVWLSPLIVAYFIITFGIITPITKLVGKLRK